MPAASSSLDELQRLSLVSKVCTELDNHLGLSDRTLAEFIIHLADEFPEPSAFRHALSENGADFPDSLSDNLLRIIGAMKPSKVQAAAGARGGGGKAAAPSAAARVPRNEKEARFPGLAMPNTTVVELEDGFQEVDPAKQEEERRRKEVQIGVELRWMFVGILWPLGCVPPSRCFVPPPQHLLQIREYAVVCAQTALFVYFVLLQGNSQHQRSYVSNTRGETLPGACNLDARPTHVLLS